MPNTKLTIRQKEVLDVTTKYIELNGFPPSFRDLGKIIDVKSPSTVFGLLSSLKKKGYVTWEEGRPRTLKIINCK